MRRIERGRVIYSEVEGVGTMTARVEGEAAHRPGETVYLTPADDRPYKFDRDGQRLA